MLRKLQNRQKKGFTLVEILVVIVIVAILATVLIPKIAGFTDKAKETGVINDFRSMQTSIQGVGILNTGFKGLIDNDDVDNLVAAINKDLDVRLTFTEDASENLVSAQLDPWGKPYQMLIDSTNDAIIVVSAGVDGKFDVVEATDVSAPSVATGAVTKTGDAAESDDLVLYVGQVQGTTVVKTAGLSKDIQ